MKRCWDCKETKSIDEFYKNKSNKDGLATECKICDKKRNAERRKSEQGKEYVKSWYEANKEITLERSRLQRINDRERQNELKKNWAKNHPEKVAASARRASAIRRNAKGVNKITAKEWEEIVEAHGGLCFWCGSDYESQDHFYPLNPRNGGIAGTHTIDNVVPSCKSCNSLKSNRDPIEFMIEKWTT